MPDRSAVRRHIDRIGSALLALEIEMSRHHFTGENAEEVDALAERLSNLTKPDKGHLTDGAVAEEFKDAA